MTEDDDKLIQTTGDAIQNISTGEKDKDEADTDKEDLSESNTEEMNDLFGDNDEDEKSNVDLGMPEVEAEDADKSEMEEGEDEAAEKKDGKDGKEEGKDGKEEGKDGVEEITERDEQHIEDEHQAQTADSATQKPDKVQGSTQKPRPVAEDDTAATPARHSPSTDDAALDSDFSQKVAIMAEPEADAISILTTVTMTDTTATTSTKKKRKSSTKRTIYYDFKPRFRDDEIDMARPSGDFGLLEEEGDTATKFYGYMEEDQKEEEEEIEEEVEEEEIVRIDREPYYQKHMELTEEINMLKVKNNILQKKLAMFFKRRKMEHVLKETDQQYDTQLKYGKKLDMYGELIEVDKAQRETITKELEELKTKRDTKYNELAEQFQGMLARETEIGNGLIYTKTGNTIPDKLVEKLVHRQQMQMEEVCRMRLKYIQLKDMVAEKQDAIAALDNIGEGLHLMDFEQLKVENRSHADKIEERDEELTRLRFKCQNTIQILAHIREKSSALESDIDDLKDDTSMIDANFLEAREQLNNIKQERDNYRLQIYKLRNDSGLLTEPELLRDMAASMEELKLTTNELEQLKEENKVKAQQIRNIRRNIEYSADGLMKKSYRNEGKKKKCASQIYKGRPSLFLPTLPANAFDYLKNFQPKVRIIRTKK